MNRQEYHNFRKKSLRSFAILVGIIIVIALL